MTEKSLNQALLKQPNHYQLKKSLKFGESKILEIKATHTDSSKILQAIAGRREKQQTKIISKHMTKYLQERLKYIQLTRVTHL